jgi:hypothetical protein
LNQGLHSVFVLAEFLQCGYQKEIQCDFYKGLLPKKKQNKVTKFQGNVFCYHRIFREWVPAGCQNALVSWPIGH